MILQQICGRDSVEGNSPCEAGNADKSSGRPIAPGGGWLDVTAGADNRGLDGGPGPRGLSEAHPRRAFGPCESRFEVHSVSRTRVGETAATDFLACVVGAPPARATEGRRLGSCARRSFERNPDLKGADIYKNYTFSIHIF